MKGSNPAKAGHPLIVIALSLAILAAAQAPPVDAVLAKMDAYLEAYEPKLSELVADESMQQELKDTFVTDYVSPELGLVGHKGTVRRKLTSEVAFVALPNDSGWLGFRQVKSVNGIALDDKRSLVTALGVTGLDPARELLQASARHNLGLHRTINLPNLPLEFLHRRNRYRLQARLDGTERVRGVTTTRVVFVENVMPTLIKQPDGSDQPSVIRAWIDPRDGRLLRAEVVTLNRLNAEAEKSDYSVRVEFEEDKKLGLLVPKQMRETFPGDPGKGTSEVNYSNYRRFTTSGRIVPQ